MGDIIRQHQYTADLNKQLTRHNAGVLLAEGDSGGDTFIISMLRDGVAEVPGNDVSVVAQFIRADGCTVVVEGTRQDNKALVTLKDACYVCEGRFTLTIKATSYGTTTTIAIIDGMIRRTTTDSLVDPEEKIVSLPELIVMAEEMSKTTEEARAALDEINSAMDGVDEAVEGAEQAVQNAEKAVQDANNAVLAVDGMTVSATAGTTASASISTQNGKKHIAFTLPKGDKGDKGDTGGKGDKGDKGDTGVGVANVYTKTVGLGDGAANVIAVELTDETVKTFQVKNGSQGSKGDPGLVWRGEWDDQTDYYSGDAVSYNGSAYIVASSASVPTGISPADDPDLWHLLAAAGAQGPKGDKGDAGKTPVKGTDYYTTAERNAMISDVTAGLAKITLVGIDDNDVQHSWTIHGAAN